MLGGYLWPHDNSNNNRLSSHNNFIAYKGKLFDRKPHYYGNLLIYKNKYYQKHVQLMKVHKLMGITPYLFIF